MTRGHFGIGIYQPKNEVNIGTLWRSAFLFEADYIFTIGKRYRQQASDTVKAWRSVPLFNFPSFDDMYEHIPFDSILIGVENSSDATSVDQFKHPERAIYLLGAEDTGLPLDVRKRCQKTVILPGKYSMNVSVAGSIIMYDRWKEHLCTKKEC